ncbi:hypothetical protein BJ741DRAFT_614834 [Chytriomyces cf. hyalinus JEL632]|nr:hypothetical protein BJ741DRAFT_614834 [Chytriomyces cf. hyalinus JEL632]
MSLDLNTSILTGKRTITESGWVYNYSWSHYDDCTWAAFLLYQLYYTLSLMNQFSYKFKRTAIWLVIFLALISNLGAAISGAAFIDCLTFSSNPVCEAQLHACYSFEALTFMFAYFLLFYRKLMLIPSEFLSSGFVDTFVLLLCVALSLALNVVCIYGNIGFCFTQDIYQAVACSVAFFYFEIWFFYCVAVMTTMERRKKFDILQLCTQTASMNVVYLTGSISYKTWGGNFYTNAMWNMGWCMLPLFCIQAVISRRFLSHFQPAGQRTPADRDSYPKRLEEGDSKSSLRLTFSPPNSPKGAQH